MSYQVLARKWRPRRFAELVGQQHVVQALSNALSHDRLHHAYLFTGTRGVGKTTVARIFARSLNCETGITATPCTQCAACTEIDEGRFIDLIEVDAASRTKVDETRELLENVQYAPTCGRFKVYLIDEVHMFSNHSFNALLKTLEEPPPHVKFLLATTDPKKLPVTILSRCLQFNLRRLLPEEIEAQLARIVESEGVAAEPGALALMAEAADGSVRDALSLLDQAIAYGAGRLLLAEVALMLGTIDREHVHALLEGLAAADAAALLERVRALAAFGCDFGAVLTDLLGALQRIAVLQVLGADPGDRPGDRHLAELAARMPAEDCQLYYQIGLIGRRDLPFAPDPRGGFEMTLLRMIAFRPGASPGAGERGQGRSRATPGPGTAARSPVPAAAAVRVAAGAMPAATGDASAGAGGAPPATLSAAQWAALVDELDVAGLVRELASNCVFAGCVDGVFRLLLDPRCAQLRNARQERRLEQSLRVHFGSQLRLAIEVADAPAADTPMARQTRRAGELDSAAAQAIAEDPNVQAICARFDGRVESTRARTDPQSNRG